MKFTTLHRVSFVLTRFKLILIGSLSCSLLHYYIFVKTILHIQIIRKAALFSGASVFFWYLSDYGIIYDRKGEGLIFLNGGVHLTIGHNHFEPQANAVFETIFE
jgi:hypothetical protein